MTSWQTARLQRLIELLDCLAVIGPATLNDLAESLDLPEELIEQTVLDVSRIGVPLDITPSGYVVPSALVERESTFSLHESVMLAMGLDLLKDNKGIESDLAGSIRLRLFPQSDDGRSSIREGDPVYTAEDPAVIDRLRAAVWKRQRLGLVYRSRESDEAAPREISPYTMVHRRSSWYVIAYCHLRDEVRTFKAARVEGARPSGKAFYQDPDYDPNDYLLYSWNIMAGKPNVVLARFDESVGRLILEKTLAHGRVWQEDNWTFMQTIVSGLEEFSWWIMQFGEHAEVMQPLELRRMLAMRCAKMAELYADAYTNRSRRLKPCRTTSP